MDSNLGQVQVVLVRDINPRVDELNGSSYARSSFPYDLVELNGKLYFTADDGENGNELWISDGTTEGTNLIKDINPDSSYNGFNYSSYPDRLTPLNGKLYFTATTGEVGNELWVTDGTTEGTNLLKDINPNVNSYGYGYSSNSQNFTEFNGRLYFGANNGVNGNELWVTDGTTEGTNLVADIDPNINEFDYAYSSYPSELTEAGGQLFFTASSTEFGTELWVTDGTTGGTRLVEDIRPGENTNYDFVYGSFPFGLTEFNDKVYFSAIDLKGRQKKVKGR